VPPRSDRCPPPARIPGGDVIAMTSVDGPGADLFDVLPFGAGIFNDSGGGRILSLLCSAAAAGGTDTNSTSLVRRHDRPPGPHADDHVLSLVVRHHVTPPRPRADDHLLFPRVDFETAVPSSYCSVVPKGKQHVVRVVAG